jgi:hypothetical protein
MNKPNWPCKCGHKKIEHLDDGLFSDCLWTSKEEECYCMKYTSDNLRYLENKLNETKSNT